MNAGGYTWLYVLGFILSASFFGLGVFLIQNPNFEVTAYNEPFYQSEFDTGWGEQTLLPAQLNGGQEIELWFLAEGPEVTECGYDAYYDEFYCDTYVIYPYDFEVWVAIYDENDSLLYEEFVDDWSRSEYWSYYGDRFFFGYWTPDYSGVYEVTAEVTYVGNMDGDFEVDPHFLYIQIAEGPYQTTRSALAVGWVLGVLGGMGLTVLIVVMFFHLSRWFMADPLTFDPEADVEPTTWRERRTVRRVQAGTYVAPVVEVRPTYHDTVTTTYVEPAYRPGVSISLGHTPRYMPRRYTRPARVGRTRFGLGGFSTSRQTSSPRRRSSFSTRPSRRSGGRSRSGGRRGGGRRR
jgi:hypothetical protein